MGLIKSAFVATGSVLADQWRDYFYCEALPENYICVKGKKKKSDKSANNCSDSVISNGSIIVVANGQCMIIVDQGQVVDICAEPGEYVYDSSTEPSVFYGDLSKNIPEIMKNIGKRFTFGGETPKNQAVYYFNTKELIGNKYGSPSPIPFRTVDKNIGLDMDITVRCFGEYSYKVTNPVLFYTNVCGNIETSYTREQIDSQLKSELMTALQPAFAKISELGVRYSALPGYTKEIAASLNDVLSQKWRELRGIEVVSFGMSSVKASAEDEQRIKELQESAVLRDPNMAGAHMVRAQAAAMQAAAANPNAGPAMAYWGMNMAQNAGGANAQYLYQMAQQQNQPITGWTCSCGAVNNSNFCAECGKRKPE